MLKKLLNIILPRDEAEARARALREAIREEAKIGGQLFGPVPAGVRREFFCLDRHTWIWHEEWTDGNNIRRVLTTRYDIRPHGIFKAQDGQPYRPLSQEEATRLLHAMYQYNQTLDAQYAPVLGLA